jgi:hypothetical protein
MRASTAKCLGINKNNYQLLMKFVRILSYSLLALTFFDNRVNSQSTTCDFENSRLLNGSFESTSSGRVSNWTLDPANNSSISFQRSSGYQKCGSYYGLLTNSVTLNNNRRSSSARVYQDVTIDPGAIGVKFTGWGGVHDPCNAEFRLIFLNASGTEIANTRQAVSVTKDVGTRPSGLQEYQLGGLIPATATKVRVEASMNRTSSQSGFYLKMEAFKVTFDMPEQLPVTLASFSAASGEGSVSVRWQTTSEVDSKEFELQHSTNASDWNVISVQRSKGGMDMTENYMYTHDSPAAGNNYYRLKMVDLDGSFDYSNLASVQFTSRNATARSYFYPNPSRGEINFERKPSRVTIFDATGRRVFESTNVLESGKVSLTGLATGSYLIKWADEIGNETTQRLILAHN